LTATAEFHKATNVTEFAKTPTDEESVADAFRSPTPGSAATNRRIDSTGWAAYWAFIFPDATVVEISGRFNTTLKIYPTHVQADERRWFSKASVIARYNVAIPVYDEIGDTVIHQLHVKSELAFLYPFVKMHAEVSVDDEVIFRQGKFEI